MRTLVVALSLIALSGCKTDKKKAPPQGGSSSGSATGSAGSAGSGGVSTGDGSASAKPADLTLPRGDGTPPLKTEKRLDKAAFDELAKLEVPGFEKAVRNTDSLFEARFLTPRPKLATTVTIAPCFDCTPMALDKWKAKEAALKNLLAEPLRDRPDTTWEIGAADLHGEPVIYTYQFAHFFGKDEVGNPFGGFSNAYVLYWNDGKNQIRVVAEYKDDPLAREDLAQIAPREDLEKLARAYLDFFTHQWAKKS